MKFRTTYKLCIASVLLLLLAVALAMSGCKPTLQATTVTDSTHTATVITHRDTLVLVPGDQARLELGADLASMQRLLQEVQRDVRVVRGQRNASLVLSHQDGVLAIEARCDSVELLLANAITTVERLTTHTRTLESTIAVERDAARFRVPGWMKGTYIMAAVVSGCIILVKLCFKLL